MTEPQRAPLWSDERIEDYANANFDASEYFEVVQGMKAVRDEYEAERTGLLRDRLVLGQRVLDENARANELQDEIVRLRTMLPSEEVQAYLRSALRVIGNSLDEPSRHFDRASQRKYRDEIDAALTWLASVEGGAPRGWHYAMDYDGDGVLRLQGDIEGELPK